ncbi:MAG TPA: BatA domain-containing protein [Blastocatellia bacterium]|nr:BatA domain-containing protein [Blastocatellia bacterium]
MSFVAPAALAALALAALPVVAHMLRRARSNSLAFPSLAFLRETPSFARALTRPNRPWLLAMRILVVAAIALAFARPVVERAADTSGESVVVLVDASASMSRPSAHDGAVAALNQLIGTLGPRDRVRVGTFDTQVTWLGDMADPSTAANSAGTYAAGYGDVNLSSALTAANDALSESAGRRRIVIVSDFQRSNGPWTMSVVDPSIQVETVQVGDSFANSFVSDIAVSGPTDAPTIQCGLTHLSDGKRALGVIAAHLPDAGASGVRMEPAGPGWRAVVTDADGLDADDARYFAVTSPRRVVVCDPAGGAPYLAAAAATAGQSDVDVVSDLTAGIGVDTTVALLGGRALAGAGDVERVRSWVETGGRAVVFATTRVDGPFPAAEDASHDIEGVVRSADPDRVEDPELDATLLSAPIRAVHTVNAMPTDTVVLKTLSGEPVAVRRAIGRGSVTVVGFGLDGVAAPLVRTGAFPALIGALVPDDPESPAVAGHRTRGFGASARVAGPDGALVPTDADGSFRPERPGIFTVTTPNGVRNVPVVVAGSESETDLLTASEAAALARPATTARATAGADAVAAFEETQGLWRLVLALALALALAELFVVSRRSVAPPPSEELR